MKPAKWARKEAQRLLDQERRKARDHANLERIVREEIEGDADLGKADFEGAGVYIDPCHYCGMPGDTVDHTTPKTALSRTEFLDAGSYPRKPLVPACRECNSTLGDRYFPTLEARKAFVKARYRVKYRKLVLTPKWTDSELAQLKHGLRSQVAQTQEARRLLMARLAW